VEKRIKLSALGATAEETRQVIARVTQIGRTIAALPVLDSRSPDEIIAYNEFGIADRS
jgi:hypothetical protein